MRRALVVLAVAAQAFQPALGSQHDELRLGAQPTAVGSVSVAELDRDIRAFLDREMTAHLSDVRSLNPPQARVVGALTTGEYTWGTFLRSLAVYSELSGATTVAGRDVARHLGEIGLVEFRLGGTRFSQIFSLFDFGRGNFGYISIDREWQQTTGSFAKPADAHMRLMRGLRAEHLSSIPERPTLPGVARFEFFRRTGRQAGVWLVRQGAAQFALPFTTATKPGVADYLPAPHGLPGFAAPVEQLVPALTPFLELDDGRTIVAADGADAIEPRDDGRGVGATWRRWALLGGKSGEHVDPAIESIVDWRLEEGALVRTERLEARRPVRIRRWRASVPSTGSRWTTIGEGGQRTDTFEGVDGRLGVALLKADWPVNIAVRATGNGADDRGARGAIPLHLEFGTGHHLATRSPTHVEAAHHTD